MTVRRLLIATAATVATAVLLSGCGLSFQNLPVDAIGQPATYPLTIQVSDAAQLRVGGLIRIGQTEVGRIGSITVHDYVADVTANITSTVRIPKGTTAALQLPSPLSEEYVALTPPTAQGVPALRGGDTIPLADTSTGPAPEDLLALLGDLLNGSGLTQVETIVTQANAALGGREGEIRTLLSRLDSVLATLNANRADIQTALTNIDALASYAAANQATINNVLTNAEPGIRAIIAQRDSFNAFIAQAGALAATVNQVIGTNRAQIAELVGNLAAPLAGLLKLKDQVGTITTDISRLGTNFSAIIPGDYLTFNLDLNVPSVLANLLGQLAGAGQQLAAPGAGIAPLLQGGTP